MTFLVLSKDTQLSLADSFYYKYKYYAIYSMLYGYSSQLSWSIMLQDQVYKINEKKKRKTNFDSNLCQVFCLESVLYRTINLKGSSP